MKTTRAWVVAACGIVLLAAGCGRKDSAGEGQAASGAGPAPGSGRLVEITGDDAMKFSLAEIRAKPGETLTVKLVNIGTMPKFSMGHNWVLLKSTDVVDAFVADAPQAATTDYIPPGRKNEILASTKLLGPKESDTVTFQAPRQPGRYPYVCSFPGHYQVGMKGDLIVE